MEGGGGLYCSTAGTERRRLSENGGLDVGGNLVLAALARDHDGEGEAACGHDDAVE